MKRAATAALILSLFAATAVLADSRPDRQNDHGRYDRNHRDDRNGNHRNGNDNRRSDGRHERRDDHRWDNRRGGDNRSHYDGRNDRHRFQNRNDHNRYDHRRFDNGRHDSHHRYDNRRHDNWRHDNRYDRRYDHRYRVGRYHAPPGYRYRHWSRGDYLPRAYYARPYIVSNYYSYRLRPPPRGCHYVRVNNDVVLAAIATGVILDVFYDHFY